MCVTSRTPRGEQLRRLLALALLGLALGVRAAPDAVRADETANCIAVMQTHTDELARQVRAGHKTLEGPLRAELVRAAALVGRTYLDGLRDGDEAKARLHAAQERQRTWDAPRRASLRQTCDKRADAELAAASRAERFVVERVARARMKRMLESP
jgi:hypothetical protein